ncbi:hypothetical protein ABPG72_006322 [Tetrahymena utriculariae]
MSNQGNWNNYFPSQQEAPKYSKCNESFNNKYENQINQASKCQDWNGNDYFYAEIVQIQIPIPSFVSAATKNKLIEAINDVQQQIDNQFTDQNPSLKNHIEKENKLFQQNLKPQMEDIKSDGTFKSTQIPRESLIQKYQILSNNFSVQKADGLRQFVQNVFASNIKQSNQLINDIQQHLNNKQNKQQQNNKKNHNKKTNLFCKDDYLCDTNFIEEILSTIYRFGFDRCDVQKMQIQTIMSDTISISFKEKNVLKTITYSILHHILCKQDLNQAKKYIYKVLEHINPNSKGFEKENYILRQLYLLLLQIIISNSNHSQLTNQFLDNIFQFEFLSSLLYDHLLFSSQKILKINSQSQDMNAIIGQLSKANDINLYLLCKKQSECKKYQYAKHESREIFIYFGQPLQQDINQPVYYVINPSDQFLCFAKTLIEISQR